MKNRRGKIKRQENRGQGGGGPPQLEAAQGMGREGKGERKMGMKVEN